MSNLDPGQFLPEEDAAFLKEKTTAFDVNREAGWIHVVFHGFRLPEAYMPGQVDLLVRLPAGYPNANPDMYWTRPDVRLRDGRIPQSADVTETYGGVPWQRWSRHFAQGSWRPGTDSLRTYVAAVQRDLSLGR